MEEHPLWPFIRAINHLGEQEELPQLRLMEPDSSEHPHQAASRVHASECALSLLFALEGEEAPIDEKHDEVLKFVLSGPLGMAIGTCSVEARWHSARSMAAFRASTKLPGFLKAALMWSRLDLEPELRRGEMPKWPDLLERAVKQLGENEALDSYWLDFCKAESSDTQDYVKRLSDAHRRTAEAARKKKDRGRKAMANRFKDHLKAYWITLALWCRTTSGILAILRPDTTDGASDLTAIDKDISRLGLAASRCSQNQSAIEIAERQSS
jgi:hypothetical protein